MIIGVFKILHKQIILQSQFLLSGQSPEPCTFFHGRLARFISDESFILFFNLEMHGRVIICMNNACSGKHRPQNFAHALCGINFFPED